MTTPWGRSPDGSMPCPSPSAWTGEAGFFDAVVPDLPPTGHGRLSEFLADPDQARARLKAALDEVLGAADQAAAE